MKIPARVIASRPSGVRSERAAVHDSQQRLPERLAQTERPSAVHAHNPEQSEHDGRDHDQANRDKTEPADHDGGTARQSIVEPVAKPGTGTGPGAERTRGAVSSGSSRATVQRLALAVPGVRFERGRGGLVRVRTHRKRLFHGCARTKRAVPGRQPRPRTLGASERLTKDVRCFDVVCTIDRFATRRW
jgi:hypothetical protein